MTYSENFRRGLLDCYQDRCENTPFASIGGLDSRHALRAPIYIHPLLATEYLKAYETAALELYGDDWRTCSFSWRHAITIEGSDEI